MASALWFLFFVLRSVAVLVALLLLFLLLLWRVLCGTSGTGRMANFVGRPTGNSILCLVIQFIVATQFIYLRFVFISSLFFLFLLITNIEFFLACDFYDFCLYDK